ncbi:MAG: hypothetical protein WD333_05935 [Dehalococcoidia bacterium]
MRVRLLILGILASLLLTACTTNEPEPTATTEPSPTTEASPTPDPTPTATAERGEYTGADGIQWLRDAGLEVTVLEEEQPVQLPNCARFGTPTEGATVTQISVEGYDSVWVYTCYVAMSEQEIFEAFDLNATSFPAENYPTVFTVDNVMVLVRGSEPEPIRNVYTALWDTTPPRELAPFALWQLLPPDGAKEAAAEAESWLVEPDGEDPRFSTATAGEARLVTIGDFTNEFSLDDALYDPLPHPDAVVWAVPATGEPADATGEGYAVVLVDSVSGLVIGATYSDEALPIEEVPEAPSAN